MRDINTLLIFIFILFFGICLFVYFRSSNRSYEKTKEGRVARDIIALFSIVMKMNGVVDKVELNIARKYFFHHFHGHLIWAVNMLNELNGKKLKRYIDYCTDLLNLHVLKYNDRLELLNVLFEIGYTCNGIDDNKIEQLRGIAKYLLIQDWDLASLEYKYECGKYSNREKQQQALEQAYKYKMEVAYTILGLKPGAPLSAIKAAYREMAKKYHPDHIPAELDEEMKEMSATLFRQITEAYNYLNEIFNPSNR